MEILFKGFHADEKGKETVIINGDKVKGNWKEGYYVKSIRKSGFVNNPTIKEIHQIWYDKKDKNGFINEQVYSEVISETVSQFIGLTDKNGKKIFVGDIVKETSIHYTTGNMQTDIYGVEFDERTYSYKLIRRFENGESFTYPTKRGYYELIGNIFSNPELLEVGK